MLSRLPVLIRPSKHSLAPQMLTHTTCPHYNEHYICTYPQHNETSARKLFPDPDQACRLVSGTGEGGFVTAPVSCGPGTSVGSVL